MSYKQEQAKEILKPTILPKFSKYPVLETNKKIIVNWNNGDKRIIISKESGIVVVCGCKIKHDNLIEGLGHRVVLK